MKKIVILQILKQNKNRFKMNKSKKMWMLAAAFILGGSVLVGCQNKNEKVKPEQKAKEENVAKSQDEVVEPKSVALVVDDYMVNEFGKHYLQGDVCIPSNFIISQDNGNAEDVLVWGDFWVFNYEVAGDTLKTVSGGSHPGLMHLRTTDDGYEVTKFEAVEDGSEYLPSAKRIFGDKFDAFQEISSAVEKREDIRLRNIADYVKKHNLKVTMVQDYGWPAVELPRGK